MRTPQTDFEKLLFANDYIKFLKKEIKELEFKIGVLCSEKDELIDTSKIRKAHEAQKIQITNLVLKNKNQKAKINELQQHIIKLKNENTTK
jgi:hypothetical protein